MKPLTKLIAVWLIFVGALALAAAATITINTDGPEPVVTVDGVEYAPTPPATQPVVVQPPATSPSTAPTLNANIAVIGDSVFAGGSVQVNGTGSTLGQYDPLTVRYHWDFGDAGSAYNELDGFNAAHVYDKPGTYTVTLTLTDPTGAVSVAKSNVVVRPDNRRTIYVASDGNDANSGLSPDAPIKSLGRVQALLGDNTKVLFKRGQTFRVDVYFQIRGDNITLGAYGIGDKPVMQWSGPGDNTFKVAGGNDVIEGLTFDTPSLAHVTSKSNLTAITLAGKNTLIRDNQFLNVDYAMWQVNGGDGALVLDNTAPLPTGLSSYFLFAEGKNVTVLGNSAANSTREHIVRTGGAVGLNISYNTFANLDLRPQGDSGDYSKGTLTLHYGEYFWVAHNTLSDGPLVIGPLNDKGFSTSRPGLLAQRAEWVVAEANTLQNTWIPVSAGSEHVLIRDNMIKNPPRNPGFAFITGGYNAEYGRTVVDVTIRNNTVISDQKYRALIRIDSGGKEVSLLKNLFVDPNTEIGAYPTALVTLENNDLSSIKISGNVYSTPKSAKVPGGYFRSVPGQITLDQWNALPNVSDERVMDITMDGDRPTNAPAGVGAGQ